MNPELLHKVSREAFEERYSTASDPWSFETSAYEQNRYTCLLQALGRSSYGVIYEPGCSVGALTARLAMRAERVIATDISPSAVKRATARCAQFSNVEIACEDIAKYTSVGSLDLVVFSEIGYYFEPTELSRISSVLARDLRAKGEFIAVHWLGHSEDHVLSGDDVHATLKGTVPLRWVKGKRHEHFRIDCWVNP